MYTASSIVIMLRKEAIPMCRKRRKEYSYF